MNSPVVEVTGVFLSNKGSDNNPDYFSSYWCFPQECLGNIFLPEQQKRQQRTRILCNSTEDSQVLGCKPNQKYRLQLSVGISPAKDKYPAQVNFQIVEMKALS